MSSFYNYMVPERIFDREIGRHSNKHLTPTLEKMDYEQKDIRGHTGCVNSIEFSRDENFVASGGDDKKVFIWKVSDMIAHRTPKPVGIMKGKHKSNIFTTEFSIDTKWVYSGGRDRTLLKHDVETGEMLLLEKFAGTQMGDLYRIKQSPLDNNLISVASERVVLTSDSRCNDRNIVCKLENGCVDTYYNAEFNPESSYLFLVSSNLDGPLVYDLRNTKKKVLGRHYFSISERMINKKGGCLSAGWNPTGTAIASIYTRSDSRYFDLVNHCCFILKDGSYVNEQTIKSLTFLDDKTIATGSDEWGIFIWKMPNKYEGQYDGSKNQSNFLVSEVPEAAKILRGHRSIPNQVRYSEINKLVMSSGVEKIIKLWSPYRVPYSYDIPFERKKGVGFSRAEAESNREKRERQSLENEMGDEMEGRATWEDVFGGDADTAEDRVTNEMFDPEVRQRFALFRDSGSWYGADSPDYNLPYDMSDIGELIDSDDDIFDGSDAEDDEIDDHVSSSGDDNEDDDDINDNEDDADAVDGNDDVDDNLDVDAMDDDDDEDEDAMDVGDEDAASDGFEEEDIDSDGSNTESLNYSPNENETASLD